MTDATGTQSLFSARRVAGIPASKPNQAAVSASASEHPTESQPATESLRDDLAFAVVPLGREKAEAILAEWDERDSLRHALLSLLEWAKRYRAGDPSLDPEEFYIATEYAQVVLDRSGGDVG